MASVLNRTTNEYIASANTPDFPPEDWLYNPDVSQVLNENEQIPTEYWIIPEDAPQVGAVITADRVAWKKSLKISDLNGAREDEEELGFDFNGVNYQPDEKENRDLYSTIASSTRYGNPLKSDYFWRASDGSNTSIANSEELVEIFSRFNERKDDIRKVYYEKLDEINALETEQEVDDYDVTTGWPEV